MHRWLLGSEGQATCAHCPATRTFSNKPKRSRRERRNFDAVIREDLIAADLISPADTSLDGYDLTSEQGRQVLEEREAVAADINLSILNPHEW